MSVSLRHLEVIRKETENRRSDVGEMQRRLQQRIQLKKADLQKQHREVAKLRDAVLESRHRMGSEQFLSMLRFAKNKKKNSLGIEAAIRGLETHTEKLSKQFVYYCKKIEILEKKQAEHELTQVNQIAESEGELLTEQALFQKRVPREPKALAESSDELQRDRLISEEDQLIREEITQRCNDRDSTVVDGSNDNTQPNTQSSERETDERGTGETAPESSEQGGFRDELQKAEHWQEGESHHVHFSFPLSETEALRVQIERKIENRLSLVISIEPNSGTDLRALKARLSATLQESGFVLEALRVVTEQHGGQK